MLSWLMPVLSLELLSQIISNMKRQQGPPHHHHHKYRSIHLSRTSHHYHTSIITYLFALSSHFTERIKIWTCMYVCIWSHLNNEQQRAEKLHVSSVHLHHLCPLLSFFCPLSLPFSSPFSLSSSGEECRCIFSASVHLCSQCSDVTASGLQRK